MARNNSAVIHITGSAVKEARLATLQGGTKAITLVVAVNTPVKDRDSGETTWEPSYFTVKSYGNGVENIAKFLKKGNLVTLHGRMKDEEWSGKDGEVRKEKVVRALPSDIQFMAVGSMQKPDAGGEEDGQPPRSDRGTSSAPGSDDIPF